MPNQLSPVPQDPLEKVQQRVSALKKKAEDLAAEAREAEAEVEEAKAQVRISQGGAARVEG